MAFQPRLDEHGQPCCTRTLADGRRAYAPNPCAPCREHHRAAERRAAGLRTSQDYTPPDSYAAGILALRSAAKRTIPTEVHLDANGIPDPYFSGLEQLRREHRR